MIVGWTKDEDESLSTCDGQIYVMFCSRRGGPKCMHEGEVNKRNKAEKKTGWPGKEQGHRDHYKDEDPDKTRPRGN